MRLYNQLSVLYIENAEIDFQLKNTNFKKMAQMKCFIPVMTVCSIHLGADDIIANIYPRKKKYIDNILMLPR